MIQIVSFTVVSLILITIIKQYNSEYVPLMEIVVGIFIFFMITKDIFKVINEIKIFSNPYTQKYEGILLKILGICIVTQIGSDLCLDAGEKSLSTKIELAGKIIITSISMPIFQAIFKIIASIIGE